jgi:tellurite methyltransferase
MEKKYWNKFYDQKLAPEIPSQFCAFFLQEANPNIKVIEFGSGNGRDSRFMARMGFKVLGIDASEQGVKTASDKALPGNQYIEMNAANLDLKLIKNFIENDNAVYIYSRFFQHSLTEVEENSMLSSIAKLEVPNIKMFFEFRNDKDEKNMKVYVDHYRRFQSEESFIKKLRGYGFSVIYSISGKGFSKYKEEDPEITRVISVKSELG